MDSIEHKSDLILHILLNEASDAEILEFSELMKDENNRRHFEQIKVLWSASSQKVIAGRRCTSDSKKQFIEYIENDKKRRRRLIVRSFSTIAAAVVLSLTLLVVKEGSLFQGGNPELASNDSSSTQIYHKTELTDITLITADGAKHIIDETIVDKELDARMVTQNSISHKRLSDTIAESVKYNTLYVPRGKKFCLELSDGTVMWINSDTKVKYPVLFPKSRREVIVEGNAYFDVAKDEKRPFSVKTGIITTTALGTIFEVNNYNKANYQITLLKGSVQVDNKQDSIILTPNNQAIAVAGRDKFETVKINGDKYGKWKEDVLVIDNDPLSTVLEKLSRWHNVEIINDTKDINEFRFSGTLEGYNVEKHLKIITNNIKIKYLIRNGIVLITQ